MIFLKFLTSGKLDLWRFEPIILLNITLFLFSTRDLRGPSTDRREILPRGRKHVQFTNVSPKVWGHGPKKILGAKNTLNLAQFRTPSHFEREFLWNGQRYPKSENYLTDSISSCVGRKKFGELWSTNHGDLEVQLYPQNRLFRKNILAPRGCFALKFLHALQNGQVLLAQSPQRMRVPPTIFFFKGGQNWLIIQRISAYNFGVKRSNLMKLCRMACHKEGITTFGGNRPLKIWESKKRPKFGAI